MKQPALSIVIANYNYGRFLEEAIQSIVSQIGEGKDQVKPGEVELIIIDGGSTDNSVDVIKKYAGGEVVVGSRSRTVESPISYWVSEPDKGQSDAFNKGFTMARGRYLTWVNADDIMPRGCIKRIVSEFKLHPTCEWFTGNFLRFVEETGLVSEIGWGPHLYPKWMQKANSPIVVFGPSSFFAKNLFDRLGGVDVNCHFAMDTDLWIRFMAAGVKQRRINCFCWAFRMHEGSKTAEFFGHALEASDKERFRDEVRRIYEKSCYSTSKRWYRLLLLWRMIDGSLLKRFILQSNLLGTSIEKIGVRNASGGVI